MVAFRLKTLFNYFIVVIVAFFVVHLSLYYGVHAFETTASMVLYPFIKAQHTFVEPIRKLLKKREKNKTLREQMLYLQERNAMLMAKNIELNGVNEYTDAIVEILNFKKKYATSEACLAQIIMKQFTSYEQSFLVDCGSLHGVTQDMVAVYKNCLVGRIVQVYPAYSKVILITDNSCKVAVYCRQSKAHGIHEGCHMLTTTLLQFVSHLHQLKENDLIISSGEGLIFPQGFGLGHLESYTIDGLYYKISVKPLLNFSELDYCYLIKKS